MKLRIARSTLIRILATTAAALGLFAVLGVTPQLLSAMRGAVAADITNPTEVAADGVCDDGAPMIRVTWANDFGVPTSWKVYRDGDQIATVGSRAYDDRAVTPGISYIYTIVACNDSGCGDGTSPPAVGRAPDNCVPNNRPPTCTGVSANPSSGTTPLTTQLTASASDPDGDALSYRWNFGDGALENGGASIGHTYNAQGGFTAIVTVEDNRGGITTCQTTVVVDSPQNRTPTCSGVTANPNPAQVLQSISFHANASDPDGDPLSYMWFFTDGATFSGEATVTHTFDNPGSYAATARISDGRGGEVTCQTTVQVDGPPNRNPVCTGVTVNPPSTTTGQPVTFTANASDPDGDPLEYEWFVNDGGPNAYGRTITRAFMNAGSYTASVTIRDGRDGVVTCSGSVTITGGGGTNHPPVCTQLVASPPAGQAPLLVSLTASASDPDGDPLSVAWSFGDGGNASGNLATSHVYYANGTYTATATISDPEGLSTTCQTAVTVGNNDDDLGNPTIIAADGSCEGTQPMIRVTWSGWNGSPTSFKLRRDGVLIATLTEPSYNDRNVALGQAYIYDVQSCDASGCANGTSPPAVGRAPTTCEEPPQNRPPVCQNVTANPSTGQAPLTVYFHASASDPDGDTLTYVWSYGDGGTLTNGADTTHTYTGVGTYQVTVTVRDGRGGQDICGTTVVVTEEPNHPPVCTGVTANPSSGPAPLAVQFHATASDPDGDTLTYVWSYGDGGTLTNGADTSHTYTANGTYQVSVTVRDTHGAQVVCGTTVVVSSNPNRPPTCSNATASPNPADVDEQITFTVQGSDPDGDPVTFRWSFGDGTGANGQTVTHAYPMEGTWTATATVRDDEGLEAQCPVTVRIEHGGGDNNPPTCSNATATPNPAEVDQDITFTVQGSDPDGDPITFRWSFGDGTAGNGQTVTHSYPFPATWTATATVRDSGGLEANCPVQVVVRRTPPNNPPVCSNATAAPNPAQVNQQVTFTVTASDPDGDTLSYSWAFGDGGSAGGQTARHSYTTAGTYTARVNVSDPQGNTVSCDTSVRITEIPPQNRPPVCSSVTVTPSTALVNQNVSFAANASDPDNDPLSYSWTFSDGQTGGNLATITRTFASAGSYTGTARITDGRGGEVTCSGTVSITTEGNANFTIEKTVSPTAIDEDGDTVTYTIRVRNTGSVPGTVTVRDTIGDNDEGVLDGSRDGELRYVEGSQEVTGATASGTIDSNEGVTLTGIAAGGTATITYEARLDADDVDPGETTEFDNTACLSTGGCDDAQVTFESPEEDVTIEKSTSPTSLRDGETATVTIRVRNRGDATVENLGVTDTVSGTDVVVGSHGGRLQYVHGSMTSSGASVRGQINDVDGVTIRELDEGDTVTITYQVRASTSGIASGSSSQATNTAILSTGDRARSTVTILGPNAPAPNPPYNPPYNPPRPYQPQPVAPPPATPRNGPLEVAGMILSALGIGGAGTFGLRKFLLGL